MRLHYYFFIPAFLFSVFLSGQVKQDKNILIQFSGVVVTEDEYGEMAPLPYTTIAVVGSSRGTYAEIDGFFSIVAATGDTMEFSRIGYKTIQHVIPDTLESKFYSWYQVMSRDSILLPEAVIYAWPSREHYKIEFLAMDVSNELKKRAEENLAQEILDRMKSDVPPDGNEAYALTRQALVTEYTYSGQYKPQNIFNPVAWAQFVKAWKRGDFKKKKKKIE
ncbi:MAG: carboxypeptidase-like regulatory domain-containing protein [Saprospiraceae bacterium]|nr:carboxypeptidase-like regulatory domain-containing protein [Bacteroidia bacterium]NNF22941.1 carboxypeptidase-like regulatory domain-containing protein [Saprospiraceae bacterium]NNK90578.1 carboxypeptidase-like regulatory domain-containing protein [Saprospiraceae bacterium]